MKDLFLLTYSKIKEGLKKNEFSSEELTLSYLNRIESVDKNIQAFLEVSPERILEEAKKSDARRKTNSLKSEFDGIPIAIKDNICISGEITSCSSKILSNFRSPYDATVITRLKSKGFLFIPRTNMDEFAMGSSTENSAFQVTKNPFDVSRIPGGSSGGSAAAVSAGMVSVSLGSDTGGSIRQPASLCGVWGLKPTYGRVSRYGLIAYASSLDQIGPFGNDLSGIIDVFDSIHGFDSHDQTSAKDKLFDRSNVSIKSWKGVKIGVMKTEETQSSPSVAKRYEEIKAKLTREGAILRELDFSLFKFSIPVYYLIATAECSSNLSRFDGIRYGQRQDGAGRLEDLYVETRSQGFGDEVKRRILLGTFSLSAGYHDAYYGKAQKARVLIKKQYDTFFKEVDCILQPTSPTTAFKVGEKTKDPIQMYLADILTTSVNLAGVPAISCPSGVDENGLPIGMQITSNHFDEERLLTYAKMLAEFPETTIQLPSVIS
jgi:aspartyl-tRNA(Asn)/glutamyl-tRNA(Gln) amidotransferase subunit A